MLLSRRSQLRAAHLYVTLKKKEGGKDKHVNDRHNLSWEYGLDDPACESDGHLGGVQRSRTRSEALMRTARLSYFTWARRDSTHALPLREFGKLCGFPEVSDLIWCFAWWLTVFLCSGYESGPLHKVTVRKMYSFSPFSKYFTLTRDMWKSHPLDTEGAGVGRLRGRGRNGSLVHSRQGMSAWKDTVGLVVRIGSDGFCN